MILINIILLVFIVGCHQKELKESDFADIRANLTKEQIIKKIGRPDNVIMSAKKARMINKKEEEKSTDSFISRYPDSIIKFFKSQEEKEKLLRKMKYSKNLYCYEYIYKEDGKKYKWHIYFVNDRVIWMSFP